MLQDRGKRLTGIRRRTLVTTVMALMVPLTALTFASTAMAEPKGIFNRFKECPTEVPGVKLCNYGLTTSGEFTIGKTRVPIKNTVVQQGGGILTPNPNESEYFLIPAKNGESLSKTEQNVPGGLADLINCEEITNAFVRGVCKGIFENGLTGVTATLELVANEHNPALFNEEALLTRVGTALTLPVRVHLKNPLLGNACYIGSESSPIELHLTTGKSGTLTGKRGETETQEEKGRSLTRIFNNSLVDNTFSVPGTEGCGEFFFIKGYLDGLVNAKLGIPNKAGENKAVLNGELYATEAENVIASEKF